MKALLETAILLGTILSLHAPGPAQEPPKAETGKEPPPAAPEAKKAVPEEKKAPPPAAKREPPAASREPPAAKRQPPAASRRPAKALPRTVPLPEAGEREVSELFPIAEKLFGCPVEPDGVEVAKTRIAITQRLSRQPVTREELAILLGACGIHLYHHEDEEGPVLVASLNPSWSPGTAVKESPRLHRKFQIRPASFDSIRKAVEAYISGKNRDLPEGETPAAMAADPRTSSIIVRASSARIIAGVEEIVAPGNRSRPEPAARLHTYSPSHLRASDLREKLLEVLSDSQKEKISLVIPRGKNILLIRSPDALYAEIEEALLSLDVEK